MKYQVELDAHGILQLAGYILPDDWTLLRHTAHEYSIVSGQNAICGLKIDTLNDGELIVESIGNYRSERILIEHINPVESLATELISRMR